MSWRFQPQRRSSAGWRVSKPIVTKWHSNAAAHRAIPATPSPGEPKPHRARRICRRIGLPVDLDRCVRPQPTRSVIFATHRPATHSTACRRTKSTAPFRKYTEFMEMCMKRRTESPRLYLASSVTEKTLVANLEERLHSILATLEECRTVLIDSADPVTAQLVSVAILQLRMNLHQIADSDLQALCEAITPDGEPAEESDDRKSQQGQRRRRSAVLKLVK
jgi:hypothetical protein